jgi:RNA polymerase subunit RPABC4/transcription elongation factor Spt4
MPMVYDLHGEPVVHGICPIPLGRALICVSCEVVLEQGFWVCPRCGSRRIEQLTGWLEQIVRATSPAVVDTPRSESAQQ